MTKFFIKYHKWLGIGLTIFILLFAISGIILNHRKLFSPIDISRSILPKEYHYNNWNNFALRGTEKINKDSILIYGNTGIWLTDSSFSDFKDFNAGFPKGIDNKKISAIFRNSKGDLFAGTHSGLFRYNFKKKQWRKINLPVEDERITDITEKDDSLLVLSRSELLKSTDYLHFSKTYLPEPQNYDNKIGLFKTLWLIHSGEIFGTAGKLFVDLIGLIFIFLSISGFIYFINPHLIKSRRKKKKKVEKLKKSIKWNLKWHNKIGWTTTIFLIITTVTGMFLRPPLLIAIVNSYVKKIPYTTLDSPNPWFDKLRRIIYDEKKNRYIIATLDGIFYSDNNFSSELNRYKIQPPLSVMGVNVFELIDTDKILVGSFIGLYEWNIRNGRIKDYISKKQYKQPKARSFPIGKNVVTGYSRHFKDKEVYFDYNSGAKLINDKASFIPMPPAIKQQPMSIWNLSLEFHTARIYRFLIGDFYILIVPFSGLFILFILISGFWVWLKKYRI